MLIKAENRIGDFMLLLTEAGKAHVINQLNLEFTPNEYVSAEEMPAHRKRVYQAWFNHCVTKLNKRNNLRIDVGLGYITFQEHMVEKVTSNAKSA